MTENRKKKVATVKTISKLIKNSAGLIVFEYQGLSASELESVRNDLKNHLANTMVFKNRFVKLAIDKAGFKELDSYLFGPNIFVFFDEEHKNATIKKIAEIEKKNKFVKIKAGIYEEKVVSDAEVRVIATLPTYEEALTILARSMLAPLQQVSLGLKMLVDEKHIKAE
ncbi:50S ribosomal protein L10 [[Mycoplasma] mobile]|uniref:Large ribosomal subunit protein uL10 n=1 Tax=Mycoplasma mobile (strain ATCC 43663 / 163K / NCTC 11711) TaxID=267748 RepID=RL10_MYCM1|nr:50S ribosomal protein L10 [[Mycoplasma] mobile]Q6KHB1.1 RecName: Full=Large ribosomal subunit protein uL10; AltName: Full=50S ribosomal protein L10 [Mycoplasma mobile 163K]AAT28019.1 50S ribosomal protein l10 [Mycoplasma mobile 163K]